MRRLLWLLALLALPAWAGVPATLYDPTGAYAGLVNKYGAQVSAVGNSATSTFVVNFNLAPTAAMDLVTLSPTAAKTVRIRRIVITNPGMQTAAGMVTIQISQCNTVGSGGAAATPKSMDVFDALASSVRTGDTTQGNQINALHAIGVWVPGAVAAATPLVFDFGAGGQIKVPTGSGGSGAPILIVKHSGAAGATGFQGYVEFTEE